MANKLFIPGPTEVMPDILKELSRPQIGHRTKEFQELFSCLKPGLRKLFGTNGDVLISTSSGSGFWEASIRNCVKEKVLFGVNGAFSKKWSEIAQRCGKIPTVIDFDLGNPVDPNKIDIALSKDNYDAFCMVHNETSTGTESDLFKISEVMKKYPDVLWLVDGVSSIGGTRIDSEKLGIDVILTSSQKALAVPPGIALAYVSEKAYKKAESIESRGYYFDFLELRKMYVKDMTPYTPSIPHLYALKKQLEKIEKEGLDNRFNRHKQMASYSQEWALKNGFKMFPKKGFWSDTISCIINTKKLDFTKIKTDMAKKGFSIDSGYGKVNKVLIEKGLDTTFRIAHMGDLNLEDIKSLTGKLEEYF